MIVRKGYDQACAEIMLRLEGKTIEKFHERCMAADFYGLFDPEPCGAVVIEHGYIHVSSLKPCGFAVRRILKAYPLLFAPIRQENIRAQRLALGLGFRFVEERDGYRIFRRTQQ